MPREAYDPGLVCGECGTPLAIQDGDIPPRYRDLDKKVTPNSILADEIRQALRETLEHPCTCGECPIEKQMTMMLGMRDMDLIGTWNRSKP